jgi:hypothetical protein
MHYPHRKAVNHLCHWAKLLKFLFFSAEDVGKRGAIAAPCVLHVWPSPLCARDSSRRKSRTALLLSRRIVRDSFPRVHVCGNVSEEISSQKTPAVCCLNHCSLLPLYLWHSWSETVLQTSVLCTLFFDSPSSVNFVKVFRIYVRSWEVE